MNDGAARPPADPAKNPKNPGGAGALKPLAPPAPLPKADAKATGGGNPAPIVIPKDYEDHYKNVEATPAQLMIDVRYLKAAKKTKEIEAAIKAYLRYRPKSEPWMYYMLADTIELNKGPANEIRTALGWAGLLSRRNNDVDSMIRSGDLMLSRGITGVDLKRGKETIRVEAGELFDLSMAKAPNRPEPILLSIKLATDTKDPIRMAASVENLLSLGWPLFDEAWREDALLQSKRLAETLRAENREAEASTLDKSVAESATRDLVIRLSWLGDAAFDLAVTEPLGATASTGRPRTVFGGAIVKSVYGKGANAGSVYSCPRGFDGDYQVRIVVVYKGDELPPGDKPGPNDKPVRKALLEIITHEGTPKERRETKVVSTDNPSPVVVSLKGGRRKTVLPFLIGPLPVPKEQAASKPGANPGKR